MIGIIGAMEEEISVILAEMSDVSVVNYLNRTFYMAKYKNTDVVVVKSGIGLVNASITTTILHTKFNVEKIIFSGVAGSTNEKVNVLDIVIGDAFIQYSFDCQKSGNYEIGQIPGENSRIIKANEKLIKIAKEIKTDLNVHYGTIISADVFVDSKKEKLNLKEEFNSLAVDMESSSVAYACKQFNTPYLIIRSISDSLTENSNLEFDKFIYLASRNSKDFLLKLLERLEDKDEFKK